MGLPDLTRLVSNADSTLRAFADKLRAIGVTLETARPIVEAARAVPAVLAPAVRSFHLRKRRDAVGFAMRMFLWNDAVTAEEARATLGELTGPLLDVGLLVSQPDGGVVSPFVLSLAGDLFLLSDELAHGDAAVMGFSENTVALGAAAFPRRPLGRVLDLGCGAGTLGVMLARGAREVIGTDVNPRALALARVNAILNGIENLELRRSDLFAEVAGESFDLIVSQPPFVPHPEGVAGASFLYGGSRGDEIALALLGGLAAHLSPRGRAVLFVEWPDDGGEPLPQRLRNALGAGALNLLILEMPPGNLDVHAAAYAAGLHPGLGPAFEHDARVRREHLEATGIRALVPTFVVVERTASPVGWTHVLQIRGLGQITLTSERLDKILGARALVRQRERLLATPLRVPEGTVLTQEQVGPGAQVPSTLSARFAPEALLPPAELSPELLGLITAIHEAPSVRAGLEQLAADMEVPVEELMAGVMPDVEEALLHGLLEIGTL